MGLLSMIKGPITRHDLRLVEWDPLDAGILNQANIWCITVY